MPSDSRAEDPSTHLTGKSHPTLKANTATASFPVSLSLTGLCIPTAKQLQDFVKGGALFARISIITNENSTSQELKVAYVLGEGHYATTRTPGLTGLDL
jgi:hypothetical protein